MIRILTLAIIGVTSLMESPFLFFPLNTFLAYIPIELSYQLLKRNKRKLSFVLAPLWLLFFPNIPYLFTDFVHVSRLTIYDLEHRIGYLNVKHWTLFTILVLVVMTYNLIGFTLAARIFQRFIPHSLPIRWCIVAGFSFLSALGVYSGRFPPRLHSAYFFTEPFKVVEIVLLNWSLKKLAIVLLFTVLHIWMLLMLDYVNHLVRETNSPVIRPHPSRNRQKRRTLTKNS